SCAAATAMTGAESSSTSPRPRKRSWTKRYPRSNKSPASSSTASARNDNKSCSTSSTRSATQPPKFPTSSPNRNLDNDRTTSPAEESLMELVVVGAGVGRTGTHSLKIALEQLLDAPCHHML